MSDVLSYTSTAESFSDSFGYAWAAVLFFLHWVCTSWIGLLLIPSMIIATVIGKTKGRGFLMFILSLFLGPIAIFIAIACRGNRTNCVFCQEKMHIDATICPHCRKEKIAPVLSHTVKPVKKIVIKKRVPDVRFSNSSDASGWQSRRIDRGGR